MNDSYIAISDWMNEKYLFYNKFIILYATKNHKPYG